MAELLFTHGNEIDRWFTSLKKLSEPLTMLNIRKILMLHGLFVNRLMSVTRDKQAARSFVSKYLHFHNPAVPIYDSVAAGLLPSLVALPTIRNFQIRPVKYSDPEYADYVRRFAKLYQSVASQGLPVTVRGLDYCLIWKAERALLHRPRWLLSPSIV